MMTHEKMTKSRRPNDPMILPVDLTQPTGGWVW